METYFGNESDGRKSVLNEKCMGNKSFFFSSQTYEMVVIHIYTHTYIYVYIFFNDEWKICINPKRKANYRQVRDTK